MAYGTDFIPIGTHSLGLALSTQVASTFNSIGNARLMMIQAVGSNARYTLDAATSPTSVAGFRLVSNAEPSIISIGAGFQLRIIGENSATKVEYQFGQ